MISYAQNCEDVVLDRALHASSGFYVDVGAASPSVASVTRHFYELGWSGINLEPLPGYSAELRRDRPRDITIEAAAGSRSGTCSFNIVDSDPDLSTADARRIGELVAEAEPMTERTIRIVTLDEVLADAEPKMVDFLKIDVEGAERDVLLGINLAIWRPKVIVVEATVSNSQLRNHQKWEELLTGRGYLFASFDGINRFYAAEEESELVELLGPANVLDAYIPASLQLINEELARLRSYIAHLETEIGRRDARVKELISLLGDGGGDA